MSACAGGGRLPLHIAVDRENPSVDVVRSIIRGYPGAYVCFSFQNNPFLLYGIITIVLTLQCLLQCLLLRRGSE